MQTCAERRRACPTAVPTCRACGTRPSIRIPSPVALLPWAEDVMKERRANNFRDQPFSFCLPGDPTPTLPLIHKFVQTRSLLVLLFEHDPHYRQIFLDGRAHPKDAGSDAGWDIQSASGRKTRWSLIRSGSTTRLGLSFTTGLPHTEMLHMTERYRRPDLGHLTVDLTSRTLERSRSRSSAT